MLDRFKDAKWYIDHGTGVYGTLACGHPTIVADTAGHSCNSQTLREDQKANARLIAVAPELLRIVQTLLEGYGGIIPFKVRVEAREAIAKAEGRA